MSKRALAVAAFLLAALTAAVAEPSGSSGVAIAHAWTRATPGGATTGAVYMAITAKPGAADRLIAARSDAALRVELHTSIDEGGVTRMRRLDSLEIPPGEPIVLRPGSHHLMLLDLKQPLKAGERLDLTLVFEKAGEITAEARIRRIGSRSLPGADARSAPGAHSNSSGGIKH